MNKELKPCPFCGGEVKVSDIFGRAGVICKDCLAEMRGYLSMTEEEVIEAWNRRKPIDDIITQLLNSYSCYIGSLEMISLDTAIKIVEKGGQE